jgi:hypothetical protein
MTQPAIPASLGQIVYLMSVQTNMHIYAVITDGSTPNLNNITLEVSSDEATAVVPGLVGAPGPAGEPQFALDLQPDILASPADLPDDLTDEDFGQYWLIEQTDDNGNVVATAAYIWWNTAFRVIPVGTQGPIGPYPVITPQVILIDPDMESYVLNTGTIANPSWTYYLAVPTGPQGPTATLNSCPDFNESTPPAIGQVVGFNGIYQDGLPLWQPMTVGAMNPLPYTVPESAFNSFSGVASNNQTVAAFSVPSNPWPWKPLVWGQLEVTGINVGLDPLLVGVEVLLGDPNNGALVATGFGNAFGGVVTILPQTSSAANASTAMTPTNSTALVPANHTGNVGTLYVNLVNEGMAAVYEYDSSNSQLFVLVCPIGTEGAVQSGVYAQFHTKVTFEAWTVTMGS